MGKPLPCCDGLDGIVLGVEWSDDDALNLSLSVCDVQSTSQHDQDCPHISTTDCICDKSKPR